MVINEQGLVQLLDAQNAPRVEILTGWLEEDSIGKYKLDLTSKLIAYDDRMRASRRVYRFSQDELSYQRYMLTTKVGEMTLHLSAK